MEKNELKIKETKKLSSFISRFLCSNHKCYAWKVNPLNANPTKWSNTLKQFVGNLSTICLSVFDHFVKLAHKELSKLAYHFFGVVKTSIFCQGIIDFKNSNYWQFLLKIVLWCSAAARKIDQSFLFLPMGWTII